VRWVHRKKYKFLLCLLGGNDIILNNEYLGINGEKIFEANILGMKPKSPKVITPPPT
jgi:hypothetical protein